MQAVLPGLNFVTFWVEGGAQILLARITACYVTEKFDGTP